MLNKKTLLISSLVLGIGLTITGCGNRGNVDEAKVKASDSFVSIIKDNKKDIGFHNSLSHWGLKLKSGEKFEWTKDTSANDIDFAMVIPGDQFINAGVDVSKLDSKDLVFKPAAKEDGMDVPNLLIKPLNLNDKKQNSNGSEDAFKRLLKVEGVPVTFDSTSKKYVLQLEEGYKISWAEKKGEGSSDITFTIKAEPLIKAGLDLDKISKDGWNYNKESNTLTKEFKVQ